MYNNHYVLFDPNVSERAWYADDKTALINILRDLLDNEFDGDYSTLYDSIYCYERSESESGYSLVELGDLLVVKVVPEKFIIDLA